MELPSDMVDMSGSWSICIFGCCFVNYCGGIRTNLECGLSGKEHHAWLVQGFVKLTGSEQQVHLQHLLHLEFRVQLLAAAFLCPVCSTS